MGIKKDKLFGNLQSSVAAQMAESTDKFAKADLVVAIARSTDSRNGHGPESRERTEGETAPDTETMNKIVAVSGRNMDDYEVKVLPIERIKDHRFNARHIYSPARIDEMAASIARNKQRTPVIVMPDPSVPGEYLLIEGRYRKRALLSLGRPTILAAIIETLSDLEAYRLSLLLNEERNAQTVLDNALAWDAMLKEGIYTGQEHIAEHLNIKQGTVSKTLAILDLPSRALDVVKTRPEAFGTRVAQELRQLAKIMTEQALEDIVEQVRDEKLSVRDLEKLRERKERPPVTRERSRAYPLQWKGEELGSIRDFDDGRLKIDLIKAPDELRAKVVDAVKKVFAEAMEKSSRD